MTVLVDFSNVLSNVVLPHDSHCENRSHYVIVVLACCMADQTELLVLTYLLRSVCSSDCKIQDMDSFHSCLSGVYPHNGLLPYTAC